MNSTFVAERRGRQYIGPVAGIGSRLLMLLVWMCDVCMMTIVVFAQTAGHYQDPEGIFSLEIPTGWQAITQTGTQGVVIVSDDLHARLTVTAEREANSSLPSPEKKLSSIKAQLSELCPEITVNQQGKATFANMTGSFFVASCSANGRERVINVSAVSGSGVLVVVNSAAPAANVTSIQTAISAVEHSITVSPARTLSPASRTGPGEPIGTATGNARQFAALKKACSIGALGKEECDQKMAALIAPAGAVDEPAQLPTADPLSNAWKPKPAANANSEVYHDSQGRYSLSVPEGWTATVATDGSGMLRLTRGSVWAQVELRSGSDDYSAMPSSLAHAILDEMAPNYHKTRLLNEGDFDCNGHAAYGANATGIDASGRDVSVMVVSIQAQGRYFLSVVSQAPTDEAEEYHNLIMKMVYSIRLSGE